MHNNSNSNSKIFPATVQLNGKSLIDDIGADETASNMRNFVSLRQTAQDLIRRVNKSGNANSG